MDEEMRLRLRLRERDLHVRSGRHLSSLLHSVCSKVKYIQIKNNNACVPGEIRECKHLHFKICFSILIHTKSAQISYKIKIIQRIIFLQRSLVDTQLLYCPHLSHTGNQCLLTFPIRTSDSLLTSLASVFLTHLRCRYSVTW